MADIDTKEIFRKIAEYPAPAKDLDEAKKRDSFGLVGAFAGAAVGGVLLGVGGAVLGAPIGLKIGHIVAGSKPAP